MNRDELWDEIGALLNLIGMLRGAIQNEIKCQEQVDAVRDFLKDLDTVGTVEQILRVEKDIYEFLGAEEKRLAENE